MRVATGQPGETTTGVAGTSRAPSALGVAWLGADEKGEGQHGWSSGDTTTKGAPSHPVLRGVRGPASDLRVSPALSSGVTAEHESLETWHPQQEAEQQQWARQG